MRALHEGGYRIPEDVAVMGFDDIEEASFAMPSLSTVVPDKQRMGELAVSFLLERIEGIAHWPSRARVEVPFHLMARESTGKVT